MNAERLRQVETKNQLGAYIIYYKLENVCIVQTKLNLCKIFDVRSDKGLLDVQHHKLITAHKAPSYPLGEKEPNLP